VRRGGTSSAAGAAMVGWREAHAREGARRAPFIGGDHTGEHEGFAPKQRRRGRGAHAAAARVGGHGRRAARKGPGAGARHGRHVVRARAPKQGLGLRAAREGGVASGCAHWSGRARCRGRKCHVAAKRSGARVRRDVTILVSFTPV
jgi:hypothetical protein